MIRERTQRKTVWLPARLYTISWGEHNPNMNAWQFPCSCSHKQIASWLSRPKSLCWCVLAWSVHSPFCFSLNSSWCFKGSRSFYTPAAAADTIFIKAEHRDRFMEDDRAFVMKFLKELYRTESKDWIVNPTKGLNSLITRTMYKINTEHRIRVYQRFWPHIEATIDADGRFFEDVWLVDSQNYLDQLLFK